MSARTIRLASLVAPAALVALVTSGAHRARMLHVVGTALGLLWAVLVIALAVRFVAAHRARLRTGAWTSPWSRVDVLTSGGAAMLWTGAGALAASAITGWASLSVIGVLGVGLVYLAAIWTAVVAGGDGPWKRATVTRAILPAIATEGEPLREEIRLGELAIPPGMRLFVQGRAQRHGAVSRYVVDGRDAGGELRLESELGPARRGEHLAPPLALWLGDVLGLARTAVFHRGEAAFTVMPKALPVDGAIALLGAGGEDARSMPTRHAPTEGTFRIREYAPGDDARRIHWVRSLQQNELVVRLPDEVPPADPAVRLVLDNELCGTSSLSCRAPDELLDALVRVWLGIARSLAAAGTRVTLVTAADRDGSLVTVERTLHARTSQDAVRLGARIAWQGTLPLETLVGDHREKQIVVSSRPRRVTLDGKVTWVVVPEVAWTTLELDPPPEPGSKHLYPIGSPENRRTRRRREKVRAVMRWHDRAFFSQIVCWTDWTRFAGDHVVRPDQGRAKVEVIP